MTTKTNPNDYSNVVRRSKHLTQIMRDINKVEAALSIEGAADLRIFTVRGTSQIRMYNREGTELYEINPSSTTITNIASDDEYLVYTYDTRNLAVVSYDTEFSSVLATWNHNIGSGTSNGIVIYDGILYLVGEDTPELVAYDWAAWRTGGFSGSPPALTGRDISLSALETDGYVISQSQPIAVNRDGHIIVFSLDGLDIQNARIAIYDAADGTLLDTENLALTGDSVHSVAISSSRALVMGTNPDELVLYDWSGTALSNKRTVPNSGTLTINNARDAGVTDTEFFYSSELPDRIVVTDVDGVEDIASTFNVDDTPSTVMRRVRTNYVHVVSVDVDQTQWNLHLTQGNTVSLGSSDAGVHVPALDALSAGVPASELANNEKYLPDPWRYIVDVRKAIERIANSGLVTNSVTSSPFNFTPGNTTNNLYYVAMTGKTTHYGLSGVPGTSWYRPHIANTRVTEYMDIDVGELRVITDLLMKETGVS